MILGEVLQWNLLGAKGDNYHNFVMFLFWMISLDIDDQKLLHET